MKKLLVLLLMIAVAGFVFAEGQGEKSGKRFAAIMGSSGLGGTWYPTACRIAGAAMKYEDLTVTVQSSGGGVENIRLMSQDQYQMGLSEPNIANYAYRGEKMFEDVGEQKNVSFITNLYPNAACAVVHKNGDIKTMYDYNVDKNGGKTYGYAPGSAGSGDEFCWMEIFSVYGAGPENMVWKPLTHTERVMAFKDRILDGIGYTTAQPSGSITEASAQMPVRILEIKGKERDEIIEKFPWYGKYTIPAGMYNGVDADVETIFIGGFVIGNADLPEDFVYKYLKAMYGKGLNEIQNVASATKAITLENSLGGNESFALPLHKGAEKFYREAGVIK